MSLARSFMKGKRWAFTPSKVTACERCVWGTGEHSCLPPGKPKRKRSKTLEVPK